MWRRIEDEHRVRRCTPSFLFLVFFPFFPSLCSSGKCRIIREPELTFFFIFSFPPFLPCATSPPPPPKRQFASATVSPLFRTFPFSLLAKGERKGHVFSLSLGTSPLPLSPIATRYDSVPWKTPLPPAELPYPPLERREKRKNSSLPLRQKKKCGPPLWFLPSRAPLSAPSRATE